MVPETPGDRNLCTQLENKPFSSHHHIFPHKNPCDTFTMARNISLHRNRCLHKAHGGTSWNHVLLCFTDQYNEYILVLWDMQLLLEKREIKLTEKLISM